MRKLTHSSRGRSGRSGGMGAWLALALIGVGGLSPVRAGSGPQPLHERIDEALAGGVGTMLPDRCSDETFVRRASLDFRGMTPTAAEVRAFAADAAPDKRARLIDASLSDPQHARQLATVMDVLLMERRGEKNVKVAEWRSWLRQQVAARTPWDELVKRMMAADGSDGAEPASRGAARWLLDRDAEPNSLARDTARLLLGVDLSCAQCHDHPRIADYRQRDYQGVLAFFNRTYLFQPDPAKPALVAERADGEASYVSVFTKIRGQARPCLPGDAPVAEPAIAPAEAWVVAPDEKDKNKRPVPRHSRRGLLADPLVRSRAFALNAANRFWAALIGRGVIDPLDLRHSANPPAADALLDVLADGLVALKFDVSAYWREIALSRAYQASFDAPDRLVEAAPDAAALRAVAETASVAELEARRRERVATEASEPLQLAAQALEAEAEAAGKAVVEARAPMEAAAAAVAQARAAVASKSELQGVLESAADRCERAAAIVVEAPELAQAAVLLKNRLATTRSEGEALAKDLLAKEADHAAKAAAVASAEQKAADIAPRLAHARSEAEVSWKSVEAAVAESRAAMETARRAARDAARATALADWQAAVQRRDDARRQVALAEQAAEAIASAAAGTRAASVSLPDDKELAAVLGQVESRQSAASAAVEAARQAVVAAETSAAAARDAAIPRWAEGFALAALTPLTPEQLCWSLLQTTGTLDQIRSQAAREWDEKNPAAAAPGAAGAAPPATVVVATAPAAAGAAAAEPSASGAVDATAAARAVARAAGIEALVEEKVRPHEDQFVRLFGNGAGSPQTDFFATSDQALYFENAGVLRGWTQPGGGNLAERLAAIAEPDALAGEMYVAVLGRSPIPEERAELARHLAARPADQRNQVISDALWALLTSSEFRFKH